MAFPKKAAQSETVMITPPNFKEATIRIIGTAPLVLNRFSTRAEVEEGMEGGDKAKKARKGQRPAKDFSAEFEGARHKSADGWDGINASGFRNALIRAGQTVGVEMTRGKMAVFIVADGIDAADGVPLVKIDSAAPEEFRAAVRNKNGSMDIRARPMWRKWACDLKVRYDADLISSESIINLVARAGEQVGVGAGRPFSSMSSGQGWGTFRVDAGKKAAS